MCIRDSLDDAEVLCDGSGAALGEVPAAGGEQRDVEQQGEHEHQGTLHDRTISGPGDTPGAFLMPERWHP